MNILLTPFNWHPSAAAGGEHYLNNLIKSLPQHNYKAITNCKEAHIHDGIEIYPQGEMQQIWNNNNDLFEWADLVIHQLIGNPYGYNKSKQHGKKNLFIAHNTSKHYFVTDKSAVLYNSHTLAGLNLYPSLPSYVLQPIVQPMSRSSGRKIALINCNENKGVMQFIELAKLLPQHQFIGYKGMYGQQITPDVPNIEWKGNGVIKWSEIGILLVPSETESWSISAQEACNAQIPVICSDLPGLRENLSYAGIYIHRDNVTLYRDTIIELMENIESYNYAAERCYERAKELAPGPRVEAFNEWLEQWIKKP